VGPVNYEATDDPDLKTETVGTLQRKYYDVFVQASEPATNWSSAPTRVRVYIANQNENPEGVSFIDGTTSASISEDASDGVEVGTVQATDPDGDTNLVYSLADNAGGRFKIENGKIKVAALTNITKTETYTVTVKVSDKDGGQGATSTYKDFLITVNPVSDGQTVSIAATDADKKEGSSDFKEYVFTVNRSNIQGDTDVSWRIVLGDHMSADEFVDFASTGTVSFTGTETTKEIRI
jgi:hypothetical protein